MSDQDEVGIEEVLATAVIAFPNPVNALLTVSGINSDESYSISDLPERSSQWAEFRQKTLRSIVTIRVDSALPNLRLVAARSALLRINC